MNSKTLYYAMYKSVVWRKLDGSAVIFTGLIPPLLPTHRVSCVARIYSGIPPIDNEQW
jgi:hypothetical protein